VFGVGSTSLRPISHMGGFVVQDVAVFDIGQRRRPARHLRQKLVIDFLEVNAFAKRLVM
jgi:hypothetical protein